MDEILTNHFRDVNTVDEQQDKSRVLKISNKESSTGVFSKGNQGKCLKNNTWIKIDDQGYEGLAEEIVSRFLSCIQGIEYVPYYSAKIVNSDTGESCIGCYSESMYKEGESFYSLYRLYQLAGKEFPSQRNPIPVRDKFDSCIAFVKKQYGVDLTEYFLTTFYIDQLICNEDRHLNNLGVVSKNGVQRPAPIFDNGLSFFARQDYWCDVPKHKLFSAVCYEPFSRHQVKTLIEMYPEFKLRIRMKDVIQLRDIYENDLYSEEDISFCFWVLFNRLNFWRDILWREI